ncbi:MAG: hypothetical protein EPO40_03445 [Myxococcaceae bacterium]|nr:MAG: hypothetical protein EPO40_03445 [Myxococcaceae bacterium]
MRVGIIAEGRADLAVLLNILKGRLGVDRSDVQALRPEYYEDETDLHEHREAQHSNWELVRRECLEREKIRDFLDSPVDEHRFLVIQIDTAEAEMPGYDVARLPRSDANYVATLRERVVATMNGWLAGEFVEHIRHAVAVDETDAWVLTVYASDAAETGILPNPKRRLHDAVNKSLSAKERARHFQLSTFAQYDERSREFRKGRTLDAHAARNASLRLFVASLRLDDPDGP